MTRNLTSYEGEEYTDVRKAVWSRGWVPWEGLSELERLDVRYDLPGVVWEMFEWCRDEGRGWLMRPRP